MLNILWERIVTIITVNQSESHRFQIEGFSPGLVGWEVWSDLLNEAAMHLISHSLPS